MTVRVYRSTDAGAPVLTGQHGALIALLDACLVQGYGALPAAGWSKPFSGTHVAVYRNAAPTGTGHCLRVNNAVASLGVAYVHGFGAMSALDTGTDGYPVGEAGMNFSGIVASSTFDATPRAWTLIADRQRLHLFVRFDGSRWLYTFFGDFASFVAPDPWACVLIASNPNNTAGSASSMVGGFSGGLRLGAPQQNGSVGISNESLGSLNGAIALARNFAGVDTPTYARLVDAVRPFDSGSSISTLGGLPTAAALPYPYPPTGGLVLNPVYLLEASVLSVNSARYRGRLPGLWAPLHERALAHGDTFAGSGNLAGRAFEVFAVWAGSSTLSEGRAIIETSNTWEMVP